MSEDIETILMDFYDKWDIPTSRISFVVYAMNKGFQNKALEILGYYKDDDSISIALTEALGSFYPEIPVLLRSLGRNDEAEGLFEKLIDHYNEANKLLEDELDKSIIRGESLKGIRQTMMLTNRVGYKDWTSRLKEILVSLQSNKK